MGGEDGFEEAVTVLAISQYSFAEVGSSACTPIACSAVAALLERLGSGIDINDASYLNNAIIAGVLSYSNMRRPSSADHMSVEEFADASSDMRLKLRRVGESFQGLLTEQNPFQNLIRNAQEIAAASSSNRGNHIGIVITKPPETVCITVPSLSCPMENRIYSFFDSHSRPEYGLTGSYLVSSSGIESVLNRLLAIFPQNTGALFDEAEDSYMQMLYSTYEATVFQVVEIQDVPKPPVPPVSANVPDFIN